MFTLFKDTAFATDVSAKYLGMALFFLVSLLVFVRGIYQQWSNNIGNTYAQINSILFFSLICAVAFFTLLPAMHERYLFPAVVMSLAYAAVNPKGIIYAVLISLISFINMALINGVTGSDIWLGLSSLCVFTLALILLEFFVGSKLHFFLKDALKLLARIKCLGLWTFIGTTYLVIHVLIQYNKFLDIELNDNQLLLSKMPYLSATQSHGTLQINKSVDSHTLSIGNKRYANGLGTHTTSNIVYALPEGATAFTFMVGVDDEAGSSSDMQFSVWGDGKQLWQSPIYYGYEENNKLESVDITHVHELTLHVDPVTSMSSDHADWVNPVITFDHNVK